MPRNPKPKAVTIVVPVYGDWPSLEQCIVSLKQHVADRHKVILVNDCGPEVEMMETNIQQAITGLDNFEYYRNPENLGFVKTCNRSVHELDRSGNDILLLNSDTVVTAGFLEELQSVLYLSDRHGCVGPRSNNATIASVPFRMRNNTSDRELDYAEHVYGQIKAYLPRFVVSPVIVGFCMLIRRDLIDKFDLFDERYGLGYSEENDFCLRINQYGYSAVMCNKAFVYHLESRSFTSEKKAQLVERNEAAMIQRYPYYREAVRRYVDYYIDPVDWFADVIAGPHKPVKILIDLQQLPYVYNGTARVAQDLLRYITTLKTKTDTEFVILTTRKLAAFHQLENHGLRIVYPDTISELFHIGFCPMQIFIEDSLLILNRYCFKVVFSLLDIIAIRCQQLLAKNFKQRPIFEDSFMLADKIITISDFTKHDALAYFGLAADKYQDKFTTIHQGFPGETFDVQLQTADFAGKAVINEVLNSRQPFILVYGNDYPHKQIKQVVRQLEKLPQVFLVVGPNGLKSNSAQVKIVPSGQIPDSYMTSLLQSCTQILFPSLYEGFGLPILEAAYYGKPLLVSDTEVSREVCALVSDQIPIAYFGQLTELPGKIQQLANQPIDVIKKHSVRSLTAYHKRAIDLLLSEATTNDSFDADALRARWSYFAHIAQYKEGAYTVVPSDIKGLVVAKLRQYPKAYQSTRKLYKRFRP